MLESVSGQRGTEDEFIRDISCGCITCATPLTSYLVVLLSQRFRVADDGLALHDTPAKLHVYRVYES